MNGNQPEGYSEYVVPPLEGLWWCSDGKFDFNKRDNWLWTSIMRQPESMEKINSFINENGLIDEVGNIRKHHEIYLSDPRRTAPEKLKTVLRHPVGKR